MLSIEEITPATAELGRQNPAYIERVGALLPNFPAEVLGSWFSEHPAAVATFFPLGFERFRFEQRMLTIEEAGAAAVLRPGKSIAALLSEIPSTHLGLHRYMHAHRTWPVPPILLHTDASAIAGTFSYPLQRPFHLLEGYNRYALAAALAADDAQPTRHAFWIVSILEG